MFKDFLKKGPIRAAHPCLPKYVSTPWDMSASSKQHSVKELWLKAEATRFHFQFLYDITFNSVGEWFDCTLTIKNIMEIKAFKTVVLFLLFDFHVIQPGM